jgi:hypothetical protein
LNSLCERIQQTVQHRFFRLRRSSDADIGWQLAGSLWLVIGGILLTGLILSI